MTGNDSINLRYTYATAGCGLGTAAGAETFAPVDCLLVHASSRAASGEPPRLQLYLQLLSQTRRPSRDCP